MRPSKNNSFLQQNSAIGQNYRLQNHFFAPDKACRLCGLAYTQNSTKSQQILLRTIVEVGRTQVNRHFLNSIYLFDC